MGEGIEAKLPKSFCHLTKSRHFCFSINRNDMIQALPEKLQAGRRNDDGVPMPANILGNPQKSAVGIFLEVKKELLALDLHPLA